MKKTLLFALMIAITGFTACKKNEAPVNEQPGNGNGNGIDRGGCIPPLNCAGWICTQHFAEVILEVTNASGGPVTVDSFVVTNLVGTPLPPAASGLPVYGYFSTSGGRYTVMNDAWVFGNQNKSIQVRAIGFVGGVQVFNEPFTIVADCCHVGKFTGKDSITIP